MGHSFSGVPTWLTASSTSGTASTGTTVTFTVNPNANSLAVGTYGPTTITFTSSDTGQGTQTRTATLIVNPPALQVSPATNIVASGQQGGPFSPSSFRYELSATYGSVKYSVTTPSWLTASPESGTGTTSAKTITLKINSSANGLNPDTYVMCSHRLSSRQRSPCGGHAWAGGPKPTFRARSCSHRRSASARCRSSRAA
jgi:hypothetical protein